MTGPALSQGSRRISCSKCQRVRKECLLLLALLLAVETAGAEAGRASWQSRLVEPGIVRARGRTAPRVPVGRETVNRLDLHDDRDRLIGKALPYSTIRRDVGKVAANGRDNIVR